MDKIAVAVVPIVKLDEWREFLRQVTEGEQAEAHRQFLRRAGVTAERVFHQPTPMGDLMVLVWEGVDQQQMADHIGSIIADPQSEYERHLREYALTQLHGVDPSSPPPPQAEAVSTVQV
jgi:hypothetical protein